MHPYFKNMDSLGKPLSDKQIAKAEPSVEQIREVEAGVAAEVERVRTAGIPAEKINARGQMTVHQRIDYLVDEGTWHPLHTLFDPMDEASGTTGVVDGIARISGRWAVVIGFDNKVMAGAWIAGQAENILRVTDIAKRLHVPLLWLVNCSGVKLPEQEKVYPNRRGNGTTFYRHAELEQEGVPVLAGIYGTNPAGGGYQGISPTYLVAHQKANIAVGGGGIVGGMSPKGHFDLEGAESLIEATRHYKAVPPGRTAIHHDETGFFRRVGETEEEVLDELKRLMAGMPAYDPDFFRVDEPREPALPPEDVERIVPFQQKMAYSMDDVIARLVDGSEHLEFRPDYGPEVYCGLAKVDGFLVGVLGNRTHGFLGAGYPKYADGKYFGVGSKLYREGLIKLNEFVTLCGRDRIPMIWMQDTSGIDVGDIAEKAELLGLGQSLIYSIQQTDVPLMMVVVRKGTAAAHYIMGGPNANRHNVFTLGTPTTEIYVMHGETAAAASYSRRLVKEQDAGRPLEPVIDKMNQMVQDYHDKSRPAYCARTGLVDEVVAYADLRRYMVAFANCCYQNPTAICPPHQMITPRIIKG